jgi:NTE family protein
VKREISLALGGGGIKGIAHIGVIKRLIELGFLIKSISGNSIGALIGSLYCAGYTTDEITDIANHYEQRSIFSYHNDGPGLLNMQSIAQFLINKLGDLTFQDLKIKFACSAVDIRTAREYVFCQSRVIDAVMATIAVPGVFPPKIIGDKEFVDGSVLNPVPVDIARWLSPKTPIIAVCLSQTPEDMDCLPVNPIPTTAPIPTPIIEQFSKLKIARAFAIFSQSIDITSMVLTELKLSADSPDVILRPISKKMGYFDLAVPSDLINQGIQSVDNSTNLLIDSVSWFSYFKRMNKKYREPIRVL